MKLQVDHLPLSMGGMRPTQGRTLAVMQVSAGSQSFNSVNTLRVLGRWMRMVTIPNQSSVAKAFEEFDDAGRMKPSSYYDRIVDVMEELVRFTVLLRPHCRPAGRPLFGAERTPACRSMQRPICRASRGTTRTLADGMIPLARRSSKTLRLLVGSVGSLDRWQPGPRSGHPERARLTSEADACSGTEYPSSPRAPPHFSARKPAVELLRPKQAGQ